MDQTKAIFNGKLDNLSNIKISPLSRAYTFSDIIYEVVPFYNKKPIAFDQHIDRLQNSAIGINLKIYLNKISEEIDLLISSSNLESGYVYYQVTRGQDKIRSHMYSENIEVETFGYVVAHQFERKTIQVMLCEDLRWGRCDIKSTSLLGNVLNMNEARSQNCDEVIMHKNNLLTEAGASNLFFIKDKKVCTPSLDNNILPGITRAILIKILSNAGIDVIQSNFTVDDLQLASSAWLTSSTKGIAPIENIVNLKNSLDLKDPLFMQCVKLFDDNFFN
ncbi:MAG: aminotransferase class IV [Candidatus Neomarinimicrobiota bacterium]